MGIDTVRIGPRLVGLGQPCMVGAEIGINHNGDLDLCRSLVDAAAAAGCEFVKFQKRTVDVVYSAEELERPRQNPFGPTNGDLKRGLEFDEDAYRAIDRHCRSVGIMWTASCWDEGSVDFVEQFDPPFYKIASASLTDDALLRHHRAKGRPIVISTGMSTLEQISHAVEVLGPDDLVLLQCTSTYPSELSEVNLRAITTLREAFGLPVGYSGHEIDLAPAIAAVALGACLVERHLTVDRTLWGSDQSASLLPDELARTVQGIRSVEAALGDGIKRVYDREVPIREKLRRVP